MKVEIQARLESGFDGLTALMAPRPPTTLLSNLSINSSAVPPAPIIGSLPPHASGSSVGSPPRLVQSTGCCATLPSGTSFR